MSHSFVLPQRTHIISVKNNPISKLYNSVTYKVSAEKFMLLNILFICIARLSSFDWIRISVTHFVSGVRFIVSSSYKKDNLLQQGSEMRKWVKKLFPAAVLEKCDLESYKALKK